MNRKVFRILLALILLLGVPLALWRLYLAHVINRQVAAIRTAGLPTNGKELNQWYATVPDHQNAALVLTQAFALRRTFSDKRADLILNLKLPKRGEPLSPEQAELLQGYVALNQDALNKAAEALKLPASRYPMDCSQLMNTPLPHLTWLKNLAELHQYAAFLAMRAGNASTAGSNIVAILALARTLDKEPCLISQFVRLRLLRIAFETLERRANAGPLAPAETTSLTAAFSQTHTTNIAVLALIGERAMTLPYFRMTKAEAATFYHPKDPDAVSNSPLPCHGPAILRLIGHYELDYGSYLIGMKHAIERLGEPPPENLRAGGYLARVGEGSTKRNRTLSGLLLSGYAGAARRENEGTAMQRLALTALAIENFAKDTGHFPQKLDDLTPKFLPEAPEDPFNGLDLLYRPTDRGYVLYSVGPDRQDNGGLESSHKKESDDKASYDITFIVER